MEAFILVLVQGGMTAAQAARLIDEHDTRVWRVLQHYYCVSQVSRLSEPQALACAISRMKNPLPPQASRRLKPAALFVFIDLDQEHNRVLFATEGKDARTVEAFKQDLEAHGGKAEQIDEACLDMSAAFTSGLTEQFPNVQLTFDNFHLMQLLGNAVDQVRREEQPTHPELKGTRYVWLKNEWNRTEKQASIFYELRSSHLATVRATHLKSVFQDIFAFDTVEEAEPLLKHWYFWARHSRIAPMIKAAKTIKKHWAGVLRWFTSRISNGLLEAINSLIQSVKAKARGFRSTRYLITMVYLIAGKLDFKLPAIAQVTHTK